MKHKIILLVMLLLLGFGYSNAQYGPVVSFTYDDGSIPGMISGFLYFKSTDFQGWFI